jgi:hypothetical protein
MKKEAIRCGQTNGDPLSYHNYGTLFSYKFLITKTEIYRFLKSYPAVPLFFKSCLGHKIETFFATQGKTFENPSEHFPLLK